MPPLGSLDVLDDRLVRNRMISAAAARGWALNSALQGRSARRRAGFPREVRHAGGRTWLHRPAARLHAARTLVELDTMLALGVVPRSVGSTAHTDHPSAGGAVGAVGDERPVWRAIAAEAGIEVVDSRAVPTGTDLAVVSSSVAVAVPEELAAYARAGIPVVVLPAADVSEQVRIVGDATGLYERAGRLVAESERTARRAVRPVGDLRVAAFTVDDAGRPHLLTAASPLASLLARFGLDAPTTATGAGSELVPLDAPGVRALATADVVLGLELHVGRLDRVERQPWLAGLPAVRAGGYRRLDPVASYALAAPSVLTLPTAVEVLAEALADRSVCAAPATDD